MLGRKGKLVSQAPPASWGTRRQKRTPTCLPGPHGLQGQLAAPVGDPGPLIDQETLSKLCVFRLPRFPSYKMGRLVVAPPEGGIRMRWTSTKGSEQHLADYGYAQYQLSIISTNRFAPCQTDSPLWETPVIHVSKRREN